MMPACFPFSLKMQVDERVQESMWVLRLWIHLYIYFHLRTDSIVTHTPLLEITWSASFFGSFWCNGLDHSPLLLLFRVCACSTLATDRVSLQIGFRTSLISADHRSLWIPLVLRLSMVHVSSLMFLSVLF